MNIVTVVTDDNGAFSFENIPVGQYRLVSQSWKDAEEFRGMLEKTGKEIHCIGRIIKRDGVYLNRDGRITEITFQGYDHFTLHSS